jgi:hypothetical protein
MSIAASLEDVPLVPSEGVGSGGAGHQAGITSNCCIHQSFTALHPYFRVFELVCGTFSGVRSMFRLPPPIPGLPGGGYPEEFQKAARVIQRNYAVHLARKKNARMEVSLSGFHFLPRDSAKSAMAQSRCHA